MKFVACVAKEHLPIYQDDRILQGIADASEAMHKFMRILLSSDYFLDSQNACEAIKCGHFFLLKYTCLARYCRDENL